MIATNIKVLIFLANNIILILLFAVSILRIVPPEWAGFWKFNNKETDGRAPRITVLQFILTSFLDSVVRGFILPLIAAFGLQKMVTLIIFLVVAFEIFFRHEISSEAVALIAIGIIALYLDRLIDTGKSIILFG